MTRFTFSLVTVLAVLVGMTSLQAAQNSKHGEMRTSLAKAEAVAGKVVSDTASTAASAVAALGQAARMTTSAMDEEMLMAARKVAKATETSSLGGGLARLTAYWCGEDHYTRHHLSATGVRLHRGHCAVDPSVIPFGSVVQVEGLGTFLAVDTGTAVVSRKAARASGHSRSERHALVIDLFFENRREGEQFAENGPKYANITWWTPRALSADVPGSSALVAFADDK